MAEETLELSGLLRRLDRLEKENRRLKRIGVVLILAAGVLVVMGQARSGRTVEAERFALTDASGRVRAQLNIVEGNSELTLYGPQGSKQVGATTTVGAGPAGPFIFLTDANGKDRVELDMGNTPMQTPALTFFDERGSSVAALIGTDGAALHLGRAGGGEHFLAAVYPGIGPYLSLSDGAGYQTAIGSTNLVTPRTGETHKTSAASIVLSNKEGNVLWSAP